MRFFVNFGVDAMNEMSPPRPVIETAARPDRNHADEEGWAHDALSPSDRTRHRARRFWKWLSLALPSSSNVMFRQKITGFDVEHRMRPGADGEIDRARIERRIEKLQEKSRSPLHQGEWSIANEIEMLLVGLMDPPTLCVEMRRQLIDARALGLEGVAEYEKYLDVTKQQEPELRAALVRLISDNQCRFRKRYLLREYVAAYTARVSLLFSLSTTLFMAMIIGLAWLAQDHMMALFFAEMGAIGPPAPPPPAGMRAFASFYVTLSAGLFGAAFSMMSQTRKRVEVSTLEDMKTNARFAMLFFRLGVGIGAAMILYFIFDTEVLGQGALTPDLPAVGFDVSTRTTVAFTSIGGLSPNKDLSLLMLWSFVAGFSEVLVPSILRQTERSGAGVKGGG